MDPASLADLATRAAALVRPGERAILGITGAPGAGKTTLAEVLVERLRDDGLKVAHVPMDGFHLADVTLAQHGTLGAKGAIETFDRDGYLALLRRLKVELAHDIYAPGFERTIEQPIAGAITIRPDDALIVTEGNYLLDDSWTAVREALDKVWFLELQDDVRMERLVRRHVEFGKSEAEAREWVKRVDEPNAHQIIECRSSADLVVNGGSESCPPDEPLD